MVKTTKQKVSSKFPTGFILSFAILWPIIIAFLVHSNFLDSLFLHQSVNGANLILNFLLLTPSALALFPLADRIDALYMTKPMKIAKWQRILLGIPVTTLGLWVVWYIYLFASLALSVG